MLSHAPSARGEHRSVSVLAAERPQRPSTAAVGAMQRAPYGCHRGAPTLPSGAAWLSRLLPPSTQQHPPLLCRLHRHAQVDATQYNQGTPALRVAEYLRLCVTRHHLRRLPTFSKQVGADLVWHTLHLPEPDALRAPPPPRHRASATAHGVVVSSISALS